MSRKQSNKLSMDQILVAYCPNGGSDQAFAKGVSLVNGTNALGINDGQLGVLSVDRRGTVNFGTFLSGGETPDQVRAIKVLQGTPASGDLTTQDPWEVGSKGYVESGVIRRNNLKAVTVQKCRPKILSNAAVVDITAPSDETAYAFIVPQNSARLLKEFGYNGKITRASFTTPDYTALSLTDDTDHFLNNILYNFNKQSKAIAVGAGRTYGQAPAVALAINVSGGSGTPIGALVCGDQVDVMNDTQNGVTTTSTITFNQAMIMALATVVSEQSAANTAGDVTAPITGSSTIEVIDLATAGDAGTIDAFIILGLEEELARGIDTLPQTLPTVDINFTEGFTTATQNTTKGYPVEGVGSGRQWKDYNDKRFQRNIHNMYVDSDRGRLDLSEGQSYIEDNKFYTSLIIDYFDVEETLTGVERSPKQLTILTCCRFDCDTVANISTNIDTNITALAAGDRASLVDLTNTIEVACCGTTSQTFASQTLTLTGRAVADETFEIGGQTYTWKAAPAAAYEVEIGAATASDDIDNAVLSIMGTDGLTPANPDVTAVNGAGDTLVVTAIIAGDVGDAITTTETMTNASWGAATLTGGSVGSSATNLAADLAAVLLSWLADCDADFNNGIDFDDFYYNGASSAMFTAAGI